MLVNGLEAGTTLCPLIDQEAVDERQKLVDDVVSKGAEALFGGQAQTGAGHFYPTTVLANVSRDARVSRKEIFGPVAPIIVWDAVDEVVEATNDTEFGFMAYVCGQDIGEVRDVVGRIESGMVAVDVDVVSDPSARSGESRDPETDEKDPPKDSTNIWSWSMCE